MRVHVQVKGRVQGVFFRAHTQEEARRLRLTGWVRNTSDGGVEAAAEGSKETLDEFISWCHHGPSLAHVTNVEVEWEEETGEFREFGIRY